MRRFINAALHARNHLHARHHRSHQPGGAEPRAAPRFGAGDEILDHRAGAPRQHRALADGVRADRLRAARWRPSTRRGELDVRGVRRSCCRRARGWWRVAHVSNALGTVLPVKRIIDAAHRARRAGAGRRRAGRAAHARSTCARWAATSTPSPATSCTARPASACSTAREALLEAMPPWQGGGDMIRTVSFEKQHLQRAAVQVRGRHARTSPAPSAWRPRWTTSKASGIEAHRRARAAAAAARHRGADAHSRHRDHRHRRRTRPPCSPSR